MKKNSYFCNLCPCFNFILIAFFLLLLLYHDLRYGNQPLFFESLKMFSQDTWVCGMLHSLSGVFMTQTQNDIYYTKNSIYPCSWNSFTYLCTGSNLKLQVYVVLCPYLLKTLLILPNFRIPGDSVFKKFYHFYYCVEQINPISTSLPGFFLSLHY